MLPLLLSVMMMDPEQATGIEGLNKVEPYQLYYHSAKNLPVGSPSLLKVTGTGNVSIAAKTKTSVVWTAPPGRYTVSLAWTTALPGGDIELHFADKVVIVADPCEQAPKPVEPPKPMPKRASAPADAIGRLQIGQRGCTGVAIEKDKKTGQWLIVTAAHCTGSVGEAGTFTLPDGKSHKVKVRAVDPTADVAVIETDSRILDLPFLDLAEMSPPRGRKVRHRGYGVDKPGSEEEGESLGMMTVDGQYTFSLNVSSGDSGGPIYDAENGRVYAVVCCTTAKEMKANVYGGSWSSIRALLDKGAKVAAEPEWTPVAIPIHHRDR